MSGCFWEFKDCWKVLGADTWVMSESVYYCTQYGVCYVSIPLLPIAAVFAVMLHLSTSRAIVMPVWPMWPHLQIIHNNVSVCVCTRARIYSLPHTHALGSSRCSSPHLFKNLSVIRTIQLFFRIRRTEGGATG